MDTDESTTFRNGKIAGLKFAAFLIRENHMYQDKDERLTDTELVWNTEIAKAARQIENAAEYLEKTHDTFMAKSDTLLAALKDIANYESLCGYEESTVNKMRQRALEAISKAEVTL